MRFWGLGSVGLHGDEETMAMPTMHIVEHGSPLLPSGMLYPRAIAQLYMMAASVMAFGESEWSFRLPSVIFGVLTIVLSFYAGRRFLTPAWNLAFTATVALLPEFIVDAQTARMYTFLIACIAGYLILLFRWERTRQRALPGAGRAGDHRRNSVPYAGGIRRVHGVLSGAGARRACTRCCSARWRSWRSSRASLPSITGSTANIRKRGI